MQISEFRDLLANDGFAATFQTMGQYRTELLRALDGLRAQADARTPLFYYRPVGEDGLYEGPVHANSVSGKLLRDAKPNEWKPLYTNPEASAPGLSDAVESTIKTIERQLELIAERAPGNYLDKRPVVQSLNAHVQRLRKALTRASAATVAEPSDMRDAYVGAREDVEIWKRRALEAEELNRKFMDSVNGPTHMGEPVVDSPKEPMNMKDLAHALSFFPDGTPAEDRLKALFPEKFDADQAAQQQAEPGADERVTEHMNLARTVYAIRTQHEETERRDWFNVGFKEGFNYRAAQSGQRGTPEQILTERRLTCEAIEGAISFGYQNTNPPPSDDHWLAPFWKIGRKQAESEQSGQRAGVAEKPWDAAVHDVVAERTRQITHEGATPIQDDGYTEGELALAASCYAMASSGYAKGQTPPIWPWHVRWWKPSYGRRDLVKAGALILAEIERLDRAAAPTQQQEGGL